MRYFGIYDFKQLGRITLKEYRMMMRAFSLRMLDKERDMHWQAWLCHVVKNTKRRGKKDVPQFRSFPAFFDYEKLENRLLGYEETSEEETEFARLMLLANGEKTESPQTGTELEEET